MGDVLKIDFMTRADRSAPQMLESIAELAPKHAFVICWPEDGKNPTFHSTTSDIPVVLLQLQQFIHKFYNGEFSE